MQSLYHPYFHSSPPATHPSKLPMPSAELVPRALPPEEIGAPLDAKGKRELKRNSEADEIPGQKKVARKLDFGEKKNGAGGGGGKGTEVW
jgi:cyclin-dependent kinase 7